MTVNRPEADLPRGLRGGSDTWDTGPAGVVLRDDWFQAAVGSATGSLAATESGSDTLVASGVVSDSPRSGSLAATESGSDTLVASGTSGGGAPALSRAVGTRVSSYSAAVTSGSTVIPDNSLVVLITKTMRDTSDVSPLTITNSGAAATWTQQVVTPSQTDQYSQRIWFHTAYFTTGGTFTFTATAASAPPGGFSALTLLPIVYQNASTTLGVSGSANNGPTDGAWTPSLSGAPAATSDVLAAIAATVAGSGNIYQTDGSGVTRLDTANLAGVYGGSVSVRTGSTAASYTWDDVLAPTSTDTIYLNSIFAALEIKQASGGGGGGATGTLSAIEIGSDVFAASGTVTPVGAAGSLTATESGSDTASASGSAIAAGSLAVSETAIFDTFGSTAASLAQGQLAGFEVGSDVAAVSVSALAQGSMAAVETGLDTAAISAGSVSAQGSLTAVEVGSDTFNGAGTAPLIGVTGFLDAVETGLDTFQGSGPIDRPTTYYGSGKVAGEAELLQKVLDKYSTIEKARAKDATAKPAPKPQPTPDPLAKAIAEAKRQRIIAEARAKNIAKAEAIAKAQAAAKEALERAQRPKIEMPFAAAAQAAAKAAADQSAEDDQIMAIMAMMLLED